MVSSLCVRWFRRAEPAHDLENPGNVHKNIRVLGRAVHPELVRAFGTVKLSCAMANDALGVNAIQSVFRYMPGAKGIVFYGEGILHRAPLFGVKPTTEAPSRRGEFRGPENFGETLALRSQRSGYAPAIA